MRRTRKVKYDGGGEDLEDKDKDKKEGRDDDEDEDDGLPWARSSNGL